jgi:hypothetical protein
VTYRPPDYYDFHERIHRRVTQGDLTGVSTLTGEHRSDVSRRHNPEEPKNLHLFNACRELAAWREVNPTIFELEVEMVTDFIFSLKEPKSNIKATDELTLKHLCDRLTTALFEGTPGEVHSAKLKLFNVLDGDLRQPRVMSAAEREREIRQAG